ncbi:MAG: hypothetical protein AB7G80_09820 [Dongiaceae bacterium]
MTKTSVISLTVNRTPINQSWAPILMTPEIQAAMRDIMPRGFPVNELSALWDTNQNAQYKLVDKPFPHIDDVMGLKGSGELWAHPDYPEVKRPHKSETEDSEGWAKYKAFVQNTILIARIPPDENNPDTNPPYGLCRVFYHQGQPSVLIMADVLKKHPQPKLLFVKDGMERFFGMGWKPVDEQNTDPKHLIEKPVCFIPEEGFPYIDHRLCHMLGYTHQCSSAGHGHHGIKHYHSLER